MKDRSSYRELDRKLKQAREAAAEKRISLVDPDVILADLLDLDYLVGDLVKDLATIFREIKPNHYEGRRPPQKSYERGILGSELFAFRWSSRIFARDMYLKFAVREGVLWLVSLHRDRSK
jgi:hypothetical protein